MCVWDPHTLKQKENLEKVKKNAARYITNDYSYTTGSTKANMHKLEWVPLEEHRARIKSTILYKGINNLIDIPIDVYQINNHQFNTRQNKRQNYRVPNSKLDCHLNSFFPSSLRLWNKIPDSVRCSQDVDSFKQSLCHITLRSRY